MTLKDTAEHAGTALDKARNVLQILLTPGRHRIAICSSHHLANVSHGWPNPTERQPGRFQADRGRDASRCARGGGQQP